MMKHVVDEKYICLEWVTSSLDFLTKGKASPLSLQDKQKVNRKYLTFRYPLYAMAPEPPKDRLEAMANPAIRHPLYDMVNLSTVY